MAYKKFIKRDGKTFGPYYYESYRGGDGRVKKRYLGTVDPDKKKFRRTTTLKALVVPTVILLAVVLSLVIFDQVESVEVGGLFSDVKDFFIKAYGGVTGLVVDEDVDVVEKTPVEEVAEPEEVPVEEASIEEVPVETPEPEIGDEVQDIGALEGEINKSEVVVEDNETATAVVNETAVEEINESEIENETVVNETLINETEVIEEINETLLNETLLNETLVNETLINETLINETLINETLLNETLVNETLINETLLNETILNISEINLSAVSTLQYKAVIGRSVKWIKVINVSNETNLSIEIPQNASNISVLTNGEIEEALGDIDEFETIVDEADREELSEGVLLTGNVALDIREGEGLLTRFWNWMTGFTISGNVVLEEDIVGDIVAGDNSTVVNVSEVVANTNASSVAVEYYTEAPVADVVELSNGKRIVVSADSALNYTEILAYALVEADIEMNDSRLKMYHFDDEGDEGDEVAGCRLQVAGDLASEVLCKLENGSDGVRSEVEFVPYDFDGDGYIDYVEWVVPHLSAQVYELIYIVKAEHLDENRTFVADVYDWVKAKDGNYTNIGEGEYLRVTFEKLLDNSKDITLYARGACEEFVVINGTEIPCEVYWVKTRLDLLRRLEDE